MGDDGPRLWDAAADAGQEHPDSSTEAGRAAAQNPLGKFLLLGILHRYCQGVGSAWTVTRLKGALARLGVKTDGRGTQVREWAADLVVERRQPVGSGPDGFYICTTPQECFDAAHWLTVRIDPLRRRADRLSALGRDLAAGQTVLGFAETDARLDDACRQAGITDLAARKGDR